MNENRRVVQDRTHFTNKSPVSGYLKLHRRVKNDLTYKQLSIDDIKSFINAGWRVRSNSVHILPN